MAGVQVTTLLPADDKAAVPRTADGAIDYGQVQADSRDVRRAPNKTPLWRPTALTPDCFARRTSSARKPS
jgi:hypothetical protein